ncbi:MAG: alpha-ketoglutarate-dependent dioxygenase AlkB [Nostoc sp. ChiQUE01a]|nr:alpha-ketoglutarate-dependent dioxygenase AlkB [Nostoc sp. ChiQUE01a]
METQNINLTRESDIAKISGLKYISEYITENEHDKLLENIDQQTWMTNLKRRVQHYGYKYDYKKRSLDSSMYLGHIPNWILNFAIRLDDDKFLQKVPDQIIINEYQPGQGISGHIDCPSCFDKTIISLSFGSSCIMQFTNEKTFEKIPILLYPRSLIVLEGAARYEWKHGIPPRKIDRYEGKEFIRTRRVSMTFRNIKLD